MNEQPITLNLDLAWIGEGPKLQYWYPFDSWCDGFVFKTPQEYEKVVWESANRTWLEAE